MTLEGKVTTGLGKGAYYMGKEVYQRRFDESLGFKPFAGTLNLEVDEDARKKFEAATPDIEIREVEEDGERFSDVVATPVKIDGVDGALIRMEITDHPLSIAEVVAPVNLREELGLEDGDTVVLEPKE